MQQPGVFVISSHCFALGRLVVDEVEILTVACAPSHQRQGLARRIIAQLLDEATSHGSVWSFLEVASDNTAAISVYQGLEFEEVGQRKNYYKRKDTAPCDALIYCENLKSLILIFIIISILYSHIILSFFNISIEPVLAECANLAMIA